MLKKLFTHHWAVNFAAGFLAWGITDRAVGYGDWSKPVEKVLVSFGIYIILTGGYGGGERSAEKGQKVQLR